MAVKNFYYLIAIGVFFTFSLYLYSSIDTEGTLGFRRQVEIDELKQKIGTLQHLIVDNGKTIDTLQEKLKDADERRAEIFEKMKAAEIEKKKAVADSPNGAEKKDEEENEKRVAVEPPAEDGGEKKNEEDSLAEIRGNRIAHVHEVLNRAKATTPSMNSVCGLRANISSPRGDLQMLDLYDSWDFANPDGGVWKQGWPITYDEEKVKSEKKLEVIVIPHSHCDPGWIMTFDEYYAKQTKSILDGMAKHLEKKDAMKFIYAEISFFEMWWREQDEATREKVKKYIRDGKLELVTGGWVMTDEANSHYHATIVELFEGHEWIVNHLGEEARPRTHWSIDPFGLSPSIPYLLTSANITNAALQRVHYVVKRELARKKNLEFHWRQLFGQSSGQKDMRAHVFPFYSYDIPHTCGPEPKICCQFDFRRQPAGGKSCDWNVPPQRITSDNVARRAHMIYDQYRKKSQLFKTNVLLVPLGDDFRYDIDFEWDEQYENYQKLFEHMNAQSDWNVHARFGTLFDYFKTLDETLKSSGEDLPTLTGDFFTYADREDHYWSGYFTSRPFYKQLDRVLQHHLRTAEIAFTLASMEEEGMLEQKFFEKLINARRALALFQHHDGVTGTAKDHVVVDYGRKMVNALSACEEVTSEALTVLLGLDSTKKMKNIEKREGHDVLPKIIVFEDDKSNVVLFNTLARTRSESVCIRVNGIDYAVETTSSESVEQQISPVVDYNEDDGKLKLRDDLFELCFTVKLGPMAAVSYRVVKANGKASKVTVTASSNVDTGKGSGFDVKSISTASDFSIGNELTVAYFDASTGLLKKIVSSADKQDVDVKTSFVHYGVRKQQKLANGGSDNPSGAYLFLPDGEARTLEAEDHSYVVIDGPIVRRVIVSAHKDVKVKQTYSIYKGQHYVDVDTEIDIRAHTNFELALRFDTNVKSGEDFYTDLNGMQMIRRKRQSKLPLQANYFPMPAGAYIEDEARRVTVHSAQALGVSSLKSGQLEVMLDRRLTGDDNRGLFQGVLDNKRTVSHLRLLVEPMNGGGHAPSERAGFHSAVSHFATWSLHYPIFVMMAEGTPKPIETKNFEEELNCDVHVVTMRTSASRTLYEKTEQLTNAQRKGALVLHRVVPDCRSKLKLADDKCAAKGYEITPKSLMPLTKEARNASLTLLYEGKLTESLSLEPNDVKSIVITW